MPVFTGPVVPAGQFSARPQPHLTVDELALRPWLPADGPAVVAAYRDPAIQQWHARSVTDEEAAEWIGSRAEQWTSEKGADWAVVGHDQVLQGRVAVNSMKLEAGFGVLAYWVVPAARGRRIAHRAVTAVTDWMFNVAGLRRLELEHSVHNAASCRVADRAGYVLEGTRRRHGPHADGWHDMHLHARLRDD